MARWFLILSAASLVGASAVFGVLFAGMGGGRHLGAAVLAGLAVRVVGALALATAVAFFVWLPSHRRGLAAMAFAALAVLAGAAVLASGLLERRHRAAIDAPGQRLRAVVEARSADGDEALAQWLAAGGPAREFPEAPSFAQGVVERLWERRRCEASPALVQAFAGFAPRQWMVMLRGLEACGEPRRQALLAGFAAQPENFAPPADLGERIALAVSLLRLAPDGALLDPFLARGFDVNAHDVDADPAASARHAPMIFAFVGRYGADAQAVAALKRRGARLDLRNPAGQTPREALLADLQSWLGDDWRGAEETERHRACLAELER